MTDWRKLTEKTVLTLKEDGIHKVGEKARLYMKRKKGREGGKLLYRRLLS